MIVQMLHSKIFYQLSLHHKHQLMKWVFGLYIQFCSFSCFIVHKNLFFLFSDETYRENVLEKQADLIRYLRERNEQLSRLVLQYKQEVRHVQSTTDHHL